MSNSSNETALGDRIRIDAILRTLRTNGHEAFDIQVPSTNDNQKIFLNVLPIRTTTLIPPKVSTQYFRDQLSFAVSKNYLLKVLKKLQVDAVLAETTRIGLVSCNVAKELSLKSLVDVHGLGFAELKGKRRGDWRQAFAIEQGVFQMADYAVVVSNYMKKYLHDVFSVEEARILVAPNGGTPQPLHAHFDLPLKVIFAGSFAYWEKVEDVVEIAKNADPAVFHFYLAGAGSLKRSLLSASGPKTFQLPT